MTTKLTDQCGKLLCLICLMLLAGNFPLLAEGNLNSLTTEIQANDQQITVSGVVTSAEGGEPLIGVTVAVKGKATGTITD
ncbi:MAG: hypothetical protein AB8G22_08460, partial [Saprospiraceae bacterium]